VPPNSAAGYRRSSTRSRLSMTTSVAAQSSRGRRPHRDHPGPGPDRHDGRAGPERGQGELPPGLAIAQPVGLERQAIANAATPPPTATYACPDTGTVPVGPLPTAQTPGQQARPALRADGWMARAALAGNRLGAGGGPARHRDERHGEQHGGQHAATPPRGPRAGVSSPAMICSYPQNTLSVRALPEPKWLMTSWRRAITWGPVAALTTSTKGLPWQIAHHFRTTSCLRSGRSR